MKIKYYALFVFIFCSVFALGQNKTDYFKSIVDTTANYELKLASLDSLIFLHRKAGQLEISTTYTEQFIDLAIEHKKYETATEVLIQVFFMINNELGQRERGLALIDKIEPFVDEMEDTYYKGGLYLKKGGGYMNGKDFKKGVEYFSKAISLYSDPDSIYKADAIFFRGQAYFEMSEFTKSINDYRLASKYYENLGDKEYTFYTLASAISIYSSMGFIEKAIEEREKFIKKKLFLNYTNGLTADYYNQAISYKKLGNIEKQLECLLKSVESSKKDINGASISAVYSSLSKYYAKTDIRKSKEFLDLAKESLANRNISFYNQHYRMSEAYYLSQTGNNKKAINVYESVLTEALASNKSSLTLEINKQLSEAYNLQKDFGNAFKHYKKYIKIKDSLFDRTKTNALAYYQTLYETEKQQSEIKQQQSDINVLAAENESKNRLMIFGGIGLFLAFLMILLYRNREHFKKKNELQRQFAQNLLLSQDLERKRISKDLHDSLGQSLLLVKNKMAGDNDGAKNLLNDAIDEMRNVSRSLYPFQLKEAGITSIINNLLTQLDENYPDTYIFGDIENIDGVLTSEHELNLFRIIQECLSNVIKHAKAQSAKLELRKEGNQIVMTLQDNGVGFDFLSKFKNLKSLGLKTIKERVRYINGVLRVESVSGNGSKFKVVIQTS